jgi:formate dehydrogenase
VALPFPKGRQAEPEEIVAVQNILGDRPRTREMLIEHLHLIQDAMGCLPAGYLQALADELQISMAEVYEVASFYAHFDIVHDGEDVPVPITVRVCESITCALANAEQLISAVEDQNLANVRVVRAPCMGRCDTAPVCEVGHRHVDHATAELVRSVVAEKKFEPVVPEYKGFEAHCAGGGYDVLRSCLEGGRSVESVMETLSDGGLRGLGGAGFPTGRKWSLVRAEPAPRLLAVNADEGEPGTFKDRYYLETDPHGFLEGMLIAAWAVEAEAVYLYLRDEYPAAREILLDEIVRLIRRFTCDGVRAPISAVKSPP